MKKPNLFIFLMSCKNSYCTINVTVKQTESTVLFSKIGQLIPEVSFATIKTALNLTALVRENEAICQTSEELKRQLDVKLKPCEKTKGVEDKHPNCGKDDSRSDMENRNEYLSIPWKNYVKKRMIEALITELSGSCEKSKESLTEIQNTFQINLALQMQRGTSLAVHSDSTASASYREKRQLITGLVIGFISSLVSTFTSQQLFKMSQSDEISGLEDNQSHIIACLQNHESRITRSEEEIAKMKKHLSNIDHELGYLIRQDVIFTEATTATMLSRKFTNHLHEFKTDCILF